VHENPIFTKTNAGGQTNVRVVTVVHELRPKRPQTKTATTMCIYQNGDHVNKIALP